MATCETTMAASSLDDSFQTSSKAGDVSLARQRRRRTTRRSETRILSQTAPQDGDIRSLSPTQSSESQTASVQPPTPVSSSLTTTTGTARQRRSQRKRESLRKTITANIEQSVLTSQCELEDSTAGVANLLERNLDQTDRGEATRQRQDPEAQDEVIVNHSAESPNNHPSEEHKEESQNQPESGPFINGEVVPSN